MPNDIIKIRMRAWDSVNKEMHYDFEFMYIKSGDENEIPSGLIFNSDLYSHNWEVWPPEEDIIRRLIPMEWIRARDEMGVPIYEGDLLSVKEKEQEWIGVAFWGTKGCAYCWDINKTEDGKLGESCTFGKRDTKFTIIGNIYQNKEIVQHLYDQKILIDQE